MYSEAQNILTPSICGENSSLNLCFDRLFCICHRITAVTIFCIQVTELVCSDRLFCIRHNGIFCIQVTEPFAVTYCSAYK